VRKRESKPSSIKPAVRPSSEIEIPESSSNRTESSAFSKSVGLVVEATFIGDGPSVGSGLALMVGEDGGATLSGMVGRDVSAKPLLGV
jgi:hypothetical protein